MGFQTEGVTAEIPLSILICPKEGVGASFEGFMKFCERSIAQGREPHLWSVWRTRPAFVVSWWCRGSEAESDCHGMRQRYDPSE